jgi:sporulation protein YqfC
MSGKTQNKKQKQNITPLKKVRTKISDVTELPYELVLNLPKITIIGDMQVAIENHKGIVEYENDVIRINSSIGMIKITGDKLTIKNIMAEEIIIFGSILMVQVVK